MAPWLQLIRLWMTSGSSCIRKKNGQLFLIFVLFCGLIFNGIGEKASKIETFTKDQLAEQFGNKPSLASTPKKKLSSLYTNGRGPGSVHQPSSASK